MAHARSAAERQIFEKERFAGLSAVSYASSKLIFASLIAVVQGIWMMGFVKYICEFPGSSLPQAVHPDSELCLNDCNLSWLLGHI